MTPPISIVTPSYQQGRFIERTIVSVVTQDIPGLEYVICDGGSSDETLGVLHRFSDRVGWLSEKDRGQADAVNKGIRGTHGPIIGWLNSDDVYYPGALRRVLRAFEEHPEADLIYGKAHHVDAEDRIVEEYPTEPWNASRLLDVCYICQPALFFRRSLADRIGLLDENLQLTMDYEYWLRASQQGATFYYLEEFLAGSRVYPETKTLGRRVEVHREMNDMLRRRVGRVPVKWIFNYAHAVVDGRGVPRTDRFRFACRVAVESWKAAYHWYGNVPAEIRRTTWKWVWDNGRESLARQLRRA